MKDTVCRETGLCLDVDDDAAGFSIPIRDKWNLINALSDAPGRKRDVDSDDEAGL